MSSIDKPVCELACVLRPKVCNVDCELAAGVAESGASAGSSTASPAEVTAEEEVYGSRKTARMSDPKKPSPEEILEPEKTHLPFWNWCRHCVKGRGKEAPHTGQAVDPIVPEVHLDFCFLGEEGEPGKTFTILVAKERQSKMTLASVMPNKPTGNRLSSIVLAFLREIGCDMCDLILKLDQEPAMQSVVPDIGRLRAAGGGGKYL